MVEFMTHTAINVKDMEASLEFYEKALGFKKMFELANPDTGKPWIVYIQVCKGQFLELFYTDPDAQITGDPEVGLNHLCFAVDDVDAIAAHIEEAGYELFIKPCIGCDNNKQTWVKDPSGVRIELMAVSPNSPHAKYM